MIEKCLLRVEDIPESEIVSLINYFLNLKDESKLKKPEDELDNAIERYLGLLLSYERINDIIMTKSLAACSIDTVNVYHFLSRRLTFD